MKVVKKKVSKTGKRVIFLFIAVLLIITVPLSVRFYKKNTLTKLKYDDKAIEAIFDKKAYKDVKGVSYSKTLNEVLKSKDYNKKYLDNYVKIEYTAHNNLASVINMLVDKNYNNAEISLILKAGNDKEIEAFAKGNYIENISGFLNYDFSKLSNIGRYIEYKNLTFEDYKETVTYVNIGLDMPYYENSREITSFGDTILLNKYNKLSENYNPADLVKIDKDYAVDDKQSGERKAVMAFMKMANDAKSEGYEIFVNSAYRSYASQQETWDTYLNSYGENYVNNYVARPGYSEHQTGLAFDVASRNSKVFKESKEYKWMLDNAYKYGFILRYSKEKEDITGYRNEPWHYRYVGEEIAKYIYENNVTFDEYYIWFLDK